MTPEQEAAVELQAAMNEAWDSGYRAAFAQTLTLLQGKFRGQPIAVLLKAADFVCDQEPEDFADSVLRVIAETTKTPDEDAALARAPEFVNTWKAGYHTGCQQCLELVQLKLNRAGPVTSFLSAVTTILNVDAHPAAAEALKRVHAARAEAEARDAARVARVGRS